MYRESKPLEKTYEQYFSIQDCRATMGGRQMVFEMMCNIACVSMRNKQEYGYTLRGGGTMNHITPENHRKS